MTSLDVRRALLAVLLCTSLPIRAQSAPEPAPALKGIDVVSYFQAGGPVKGQAAFRHDFDGARYLFSSAQNKAAFVADPDRYLPQFGGLCTTGLSKGVPSESDPLVWKIVNGKLYLFSRAASVPADAGMHETVNRANEHWAARRK